MGVGKERFGIGVWRKSNAEVIALISGFVDLHVFQRAYNDSLELHKISLTFPKIEQYGGLADQMRRASKSVAMDIAEGFGRRSSLADFKRFINMALGSNGEVRVQLMYCKDLGYINEDVYAHYDANNTATGKQLVTMLRSWKPLQ